MKALRFIPIMLLLFLPFAGEAQKQYSHTGMTVETLTSDTVIDLTPSITEAGYTVTADTNITFDVSTSYVRPGAMIYIKVTADASNRIVTFRDNITATTDTITATKIKTYVFWYDGTGYILISSQAVTWYKPPLIYEFYAHNSTNNDNLTRYLSQANSPRLSGPYLTQKFSFNRQNTASTTFC